MRTILHLVALVWGVGIVYFSFSEGLPRPVNAYGWGQLAAFGFGLLMVMVGLRHFWLRLNDNDAALTGGTALFGIALAAALTAGSMAWRSGGRPTKECHQIIDHVHTLFDARDPSGRMGAELEARRPTLVRKCEELPTERRRCPLRATTYDEFVACP